jgi:hypothetical protein
MIYNETGQGGIVAMSDGLTPAPDYQGMRLNKVVIETIGPGKNYEDLWAWSEAQTKNINLPKLYGIKVSGDVSDIDYPRNVHCISQDPNESFYDQTVCLGYRESYLLGPDQQSPSDGFMALNVRTIYHRLPKEGDLIYSDGPFTLEEIHYESIREKLECYAFNDDYPSFTRVGFGRYTDELSDFTIYTPESERHNGTFAEGYRRTTDGVSGRSLGGLMYIGNYGLIENAQSHNHTYMAAADHITFDGLTFIETLGYNTINLANDSTILKISNCLILEEGIGSGYVHGIWIKGDKNHVEISNTVIRLHDRYNEAWCFYQSGSDNTVICHNVTTSGGTIGYYSNGVGVDIGTVTLKNCLWSEGGSSAGIGFDGNNMTASYCSDESDSLDGWGATNRFNQTFSFVNYDTNPPWLYGRYEYFQLEEDDTGAYTHGTDLSDDEVLAFETDIIGVTRPAWGSWSIGAFDGPLWEVSGGTKGGGTADLTSNHATPISGGIKSNGAFDVTKVGLHISKIGTIAGVTQDYATLDAWASTEERDLTETYKVHISNKTGSYGARGTSLSFSPSGATADYIEDDGSFMRFTVGSGTPAIGDTITGGGGSSTLEDIQYTQEIEMAEIYQLTEAVNLDLKSLYLGNPIWGTSTDAFIKIATHPNYRHIGIFEESLGYLSSTGAVHPIIDLSGSQTENNKLHIHLDGLQLKCDCYYAIDCYYADMKLSNCLMAGHQTGGYAVRLTLGYQKIDIWNNVMYSPTSGDYFQYGVTQIGTSYNCNLAIYNNTILGRRCIDIPTLLSSNQSQLYVKNNICIDTSNNNDAITIPDDQWLEMFYLAYAHSNNLTNGTSSPDEEFRNKDPQFLGGKPSTDWVVDLRLHDDDTDAKDQAAVLLGDSRLRFTNDFVDYDRGTVWDIGASEADPANTTLFITMEGGVKCGGAASLVANHLSTVGPGKDFATFEDWAATARNLTTTWRVLYDATGSFSGDYKVSWGSESEDEGYGDLVETDNTSFIRIDVTSGEPEVGDTVYEWIEPSTYTEKGTITGISYELEREFVECYAFEDNSTSKDVSADWTTSSECYIKIYTPENERHIGVPGTGYRLKNTENSLRIFVPYVWLDGISHESNGTQLVVNTSENGSTKISNCLFYQNDMNNETGLGLYFVGGVSDNNWVEMWNTTVIINTFSTDWIGSRAIYPSGSYTRYYFKNCTSVGGNNGFDIAVWVPYIHAQNCITAKKWAAMPFSGFNNFDYDSTDTTYIADYCATEDNSLIDVDGTQNINDASFDFVDPANTNYLLSFTDSDAFNNGMDLSDDFTADIVGTPRPQWNNWSMGSSEAQPVGFGGITMGGTYDHGTQINPTVGGGIAVGGASRHFGPHNTEVDGGVLVNGEALILHGIVPDGGCIVSGSANINVILDIQTTSGVTVGGQGLRSQYETGSGGCVVNGLSKPGFLYAMEVEGGVYVGGDSIYLLTIGTSGGIFVNGSGPELRKAVPAISGGVQISGEAYSPAIIREIMHSGVVVGGDAIAQNFIPMHGGATINGEATIVSIVSKYLNVPNQAAHGLRNSTFVFWLKTDSTDEQFIMSGANSDRDDEILIKLEDGQIRFLNHTKGN